MPKVDTDVYLVHNTFLGADAADIRLFADFTGDNFVVHRNVFTFGQSAFRFFKDALGKSGINSRWQVRSNLCTQLPQQLNAFSNDSFIVSPDMVFLALSPNDRNYARIKTGSTIANKAPFVASAGALPSGPAPDSGNWFTLLQDRIRDIESNQ